MDNQYRIVEVSQRPALAENVEAIASLRANVGFLALIERLSLQRAVVQERLATAPIADVPFLQAGVKWLGYLEDEVKRATGVVVRRAERPTIDELEEFKKIDAFLERVE